MTSELIKEMREWQKEWSMPSMLYGAWALWMEELDEILSRHEAAIEAEKSGEVVLAKGCLDYSEPNPWSGKHYYCNNHPKATGPVGQLIFRPGNGE